MSLKLGILKAIAESVRTVDDIRLMMDKLRVVRDPHKVAPVTIIKVSCM